MPEDSHRNVAAGHLRLAEGLIKTANISDGSSEYEIRNAFSRAYYALFHACVGFLWAQSLANVKEIAKSHGRLQGEMGRRMGKRFGRVLGNCRELRRNSDYSPEWSIPAFYVCADNLKQARKHAYYVMQTAKNLISRT